MRLLIVLPDVPSRIRPRSYHFIRLLARRHEIALLVASPEREIEEATRFRGICRSVDVVPVRLKERLRSGASAALHGEPVLAAVGASPELTRRLAKLVTGGHFDLVHVEHLRMGYVGARIPKHLPTVFDSVGCVSLLHERTLHHSHSLRQRLLALLELRRTRRYEARLMRDFDRIAAATPENARVLRALVPGTAVTVIANGVDLDHFRPFDGPREPATLVFSGELSNPANVAAMLQFVRQSLPRIQNVRPDASLRIVGSDPPPSILALTRDPAISVSDHVPDPREAIVTATVAICPVKADVGIRNDVLEAMAMGLPVVCTREVAEGLRGQPGRDYLVADSPIAFAAQVCRLLNDPILRGEMREASRRYVETHHRWEDAANRLEALYADAIALKRAGYKALTTASG